MKVLLKVAFVVLLSACRTNGEVENNSESMARDIPEIREMLEKFHSQRSRLKFTGCLVDYNGQSFGLGVSVEQVVNVLGPYDYFNRGYYVWKNAGLILASTKSREEGNDVTLDVGQINLNVEVDERDLEKYKHLLERNQSYILFNGIPVDNKTTIQSFFELSLYEYNDVKINSHSYRFDENCQNPSASISYYLDAPGGWNYEGEGHLRYKTTVNKNNSNTISRIGFQIN